MNSYMDLGETVGKFLFSATFPNSGIRARSMRKFSIARVEQPFFVGVDLVNFLAVTSPFLLQRYCGMKRPGPTLHISLRETGSPTDMH